MALTPGAQSQVKTWAPIAGGIAAAWWTYQKRENIKESVLFGGIVAFLCWLVASQALKAAVTAANRPDQVYIQPDATGSNTAGGNTQTWSPAAITKELRDDVYTTWVLRNNNLYERLVALSNSQLSACYNEWSNRYWSEKNETMTQAMDSEYYGLSGLDTRARAQTITARLKGLGLY